MLYGDWDALRQFFEEFDRDIYYSTVRYSQRMEVYRTRDYGLDMLACYWIALITTTTLMYLKNYETD